MAVLLASSNRAEAVPENLYGLLQTSNSNYLLTYDLTQDFGSTFGYESSTLAPLQFTNLLPQNSISSIAVEATTLYGLIRTSNSNYLVTYDLTQNFASTFGYESSTLASLKYTNLLPQNSVSSIAVQGTTLYGLLRTPATDYLITYDLTQNFASTFGYEASTLAPLNITNLLPQNGIVAIAVDSVSGDGSPTGGGEGSMPIPEPGGTAGLVICLMTMMIVRNGSSRLQ